jgi:hypothetical protein
MKTPAQLDAEIAEALRRDARKTQHIRAGGQMRADKRYTSAIKRKINNACRTLCGAEPGHDDYDRATAASFIERFSKLKPEWIADMCPACREKAGI